MMMNTATVTTFTRIMISTIVILIPTANPNEETTD